MADKYKYNPLTGKMDIVGSAGGAIDNITYTNTNPVQEPIGGIVAGETFVDVPLKQMLDKIIYKQVAPAVQMVLRSGQAATKLPIDTTVVAAYNASVTIKSNKVVLVEFGTIADGRFATLQTKEVNMTTNETVEFNQINITRSSMGSIAYAVRVTDINGLVGMSNTATYTFGHERKYSLLAAETGTAEGIFAQLGNPAILTSKTDSAQSIPVTTNGSYFWYAVPTALGISEFSDYSGQLVGICSKIHVVIEGKSYDIWRSNKPSDSGSVFSFKTK